MFNGPFNGTIRVSRYQKGKTNPDFTEASDSGISWAICKSLHLAPGRQPRQHLTTQFSTGRVPFLPPNQQRQSTESMYVRINARMDERCETYAAGPSTVWVDARKLTVGPRQRLELRALLLSCLPVCSRSAWNVVVPEEM